MFAKVRSLLAAPVSEIKKWWSIWTGFASIVALAGIPEIDRHWPDLAPTIVAWFPKNGAQWAPIIGTAIGIAARVISQQAVLDQIRALFGKRRKGDGNGAE